jgi:hypothetical protein
MPREMNECKHRTCSHTEGHTEGLRKEQRGKWEAMRRMPVAIPFKPMVKTRVHLGGGTKLTGKFEHVGTVFELFLSCCAGMFCVGVVAPADSADCGN